MTQKRKYPFLQTDVGALHADPEYLSLSWKERGIFRHIVDLYWLNPDSPLPADHKKLAKICGTHPQVIRELFSKMKSYFEICPQGHLQILELDEQRARTDELREKKAEAGRKSQAKQRGEKSTPVPTPVKLIDNDNDNHNDKSSKSISMVSLKSGSGETAESILQKLRDNFNATENDIRSFRSQIVKLGLKDEAVRMAYHTLITSNGIREPMKYFTTCLRRSISQFTPDPIQLSHNTQAPASPAYCKQGLYDFGNEEASQDLVWLLCSDDQRDNTGILLLEEATPGLTDEQREYIAAGIKIQNPQTFYRQALVGLAEDALKTFEAQKAAMS